MHAFNKSRSMAVLISASCCGSMAAAQQTAPPPVQAAAGSAAWSRSKNIGVFGRNSQTADQQLKDESVCYGPSRQQSGVDPKAATPFGKTAEQKVAAEDADKAIEISNLARGALCESS
jgi:hypothetical protein